MNNKLSKDAYGGVVGKNYVPYISTGSKSGGNVVVLIIGIILAILFAASTAYSGMKSGLTVAAGIPGSIIGSAFIAVFAKQKGILGKNLASGGESVASGVIFLLNLPIMAIAIGFYLPISTTTIILIGALVRLFVEKTSKSEKEKEAKVSNGISLSSGLVAGGSIIGLVGIIFQVTGILKGIEPSGFSASNGMAFIILLGLIIATIIPILGSKTKNAEK